MSKMDWKASGRSGGGSAMRLGRLQSRDSYDEYLMAMKRVYHHSSNLPYEMMSPRERYRKQSKIQSQMGAAGGSWDMQQATRISTITSMIPDEIIYNHEDYSIRSYETALMFIDVSGFTELCETYTKAGRGGPSKLTQVLNSYIGAMVQEILTHNGDVLKFSGDAFLSMWKKTSKLTMQDVVHTAIDCGLIIQKNYGTHVTDVGVVLKVKVAIAAGLSHFSLIGNETMSHYVIVGQPVWDVKMAEYMSTAGDVITTAAAWTYVNEAEYCTQPCGDGRHTKVLGVGVTWKRAEKLGYAVGMGPNIDFSQEFPVPINRGFEDDELSEIRSYRGYSLRPSVISTLRSSWWPELRRFMLTTVLRAVDNDEPMDFLTEVRHVVVVFLNLITKSVTEDVLVNIVDTAYKCVCSISSENFGLVNKVSMFDKDMMFLVVFGLRGLKHEDEAQNALLCAFQLKQTLNDSNILSVSIGVTSGRTYCGVVGHVLRREYTVIGSAVNKAARLMMAYPNKVTCDKETFVRSKLDLDFFRLMPLKSLKGIAKPGPVYEFNKAGWPGRLVFWRHPILGRNEELRRYKQLLQNAMSHQKERFTRYRDHQYAVAIIGPKLVGKDRLMEEFLNMTPNFIRVEKIILNENDPPTPYRVIRMMITKLFTGGHMRSLRENVENRIRYSFGAMSLTPLQIYAVNTIFDCRFPLPDKFSYPGDILSEFSVKNVVYEICKTNFPSLRVVAIKDADYMDNESWRIILLLLETKNIFVICTINDESYLSTVAKTCIANNMIVKMYITGIDRWYHGALACQLLDVQAIPADLEKVIESASGGLPGWIQNFVISLVQRGELSVVTVPRSEAIEAGAVLPSPVLLQRLDDASKPGIETGIRRGSGLDSQTDSVYSVSALSKHDSISVSETAMIQMAVLPESYNFGDIHVNMTMDVIILKTYDSLTSFEKMLLKCGSVLGESFSRRMLLHLLQCDSERKVSQAVAKLFMIRVLECEGGDFTRDTSAVLIHPAPAMPLAKPPHCRCLGTRPQPNCGDLPLYAFCGYMKFRHSVFKTTTYELLTESQKHEMHSRALLYYERNTRRCTNCGAGCFIKLFGVRSDDGLVPESAGVKRVREQICAISAETRFTSEYLPYDNVSHFTFDPETCEQAQDLPVHPTKTYNKVKRVRSFSSLELGTCECMSILLSVYTEVIDHSRAVGECEKIFETYMEFADLSIINLNIPQALRLLSEVEEFVMTPKVCNSEVCKIRWMKDYRMARILTLRGSCMLESGELSEAKTHLLRAMKLYCLPFPSTKTSVGFRNMTASFQQLMSMYVCPRWYVGTERVGIIGEFYNDVARALTRLFRLFKENKEYDNAALAAKWSLNYALRTNNTFRLLCVAYASMIHVYRQNRRFAYCVKLEKQALEMCHRKRGQLDVTEVYAVCALYTNIFLFYVEYGRKMESLEFGLSVIPLMTGFSDLSTSQMLVLWMLKLLLTDMRIHEMIMIMREFFYMTDHYDMSSETWYYYYAIVILLDTGYCVESYGTCEKFYIKKGDTIMRSKTPEAAWNFFVSMWLVTVRVGAWERSIIWEEKLRQIVTMKFQKNEFVTMALIRLVEGYLISLVNEIDNRNIKKIIIIKKTVKSMFVEIEKGCNHAPMYKPRYLLLYAYYHYVIEKKSKAFKYLNKSSELATQYVHGTLHVWIQHTRNHWKGILNPKYEDYWAEHIEADNLLDYRDFDPEKSQIVPYTLPLPKDFEK